MVAQKPVVLVAEDDEEFRSELTDILHDEGYDVVGARDGSEALKIIESQPLDLGLVDLNMPGLEGMDLLEKSVQIDPTLPIVILTGYASIERAVKAIRLGAYDFIEKTADLERLLLTVGRAIERRRMHQQMKWMADDILERYKMVGTSKAMQHLYRIIDQVAPADCTVLIHGETGVGKELVSMALHMQSQRAKGPFIRINCAAMPDTLIESELFGHKKGAFTGAIENKMGKFLAADGGTIFLDEIGDLSISAQAKILRVLQEKEFEPLGDVRTHKVDVRVIAATNKDLQQAMAEKSFRTDLYYRLSAVEIHVPPLRDRKEDIPDLAMHFLKIYCEKNNRFISGFEPKALQLLMQQDWPGNVRQLESIVERLVLFASGQRINESEVALVLNLSSFGAQSGLMTFRQAREAFDREFITNALIAHDWNVQKAAKTLGLDRTNLYKKMQQLGIAR